VWGGEVRSGEIFLGQMAKVLRPFIGPERRGGEPSVEELISRRQCIINPFHFTNGG
jgi:hypothetical protein